jgi:Uma2 family endonuclease
MNVALQRHWTIEQSLDWAGAQEGRYECDGSRPVAMTGGNARHSQVTINIHTALRSRLRGAPCANYGPDLGVETIGSKVRYPDALITCTKFPGTDRFAPDVRVVFEVLGPSSGRSGRSDRIEKVRAYAGVPSIRRYIILETSDAGLLVLHRQDANDDWSAAALTLDDTLHLPELGIEVPAAEFYEDVAFNPALAD